MSAEVVEERPTLTLAEWQAEGTRRYGHHFRFWAFVCPMCGNIASAADFVRLGAEPHRAYQECIGRVHNEQREKAVEVHSWGKGKPCDWAAFGLFGTMNGGTKITEIPPDQGREPERWVFDFAPLIFTVPEDAVEAAQRIGYPVVVDVPGNGQNVRNVCKDAPALDTAFRICLTRGPVHLTPHVP